MVEPAKDSTGLATDQVSVQNQRMKRCSRLLRTSLLVLAFSAAVSKSHKYSLFNIKQ